MTSSRRPDPIRASFVALALSFASSSFPAFLAGRVYRGCRFSSRETFSTKGSSTTLPLPLVRPLGPQADRETRYVEVGQGGNQLGPSFAISPETPSLVLNRWPHRGESSEEELQPEFNRRVHKSYKASVEHLVHPALLAYDDPVRVAVLVDEGGIGTVVEEVLKHASVRDVDVFAPSGRQGAVLGNECKLDHDFDDPRVSRIQTVAESLPSALRQRAGSVGAYDVILWNRSDGENRRFALTNNSSAARSTAEDMLATLHETLKASAESLSGHGVVCISGGAVGAAERASVPEAVDRAGLESLVDYDHDKTTFWLAMKSRLSRATWFGRNQAEAELSLRRRFSELTLSSIASVDSATLMSHKFPSRLSERAWCTEHKEECGGGRGFDPFVPNAPTQSFEVKHSGVGERAGRGIFAREKVPKGSTLGMDTCVYGMFLPPGTYKLLTSMYLPNATEHSDEDLLASDALWKPVHGYVYGYGWVDSNYGMSSAGVDASILTFINHGCNGTYNTGTELNVTEQSAVPGIGPAANGYVAEGASVGDTLVYNPSRDRNYPEWGCDDTTRALRDISAGEEVLDNYLVFGGSESGVEWEEVLIELKRICSGEVGIITQYEDSQGGR